MSRVERRRAETRERIVTEAMRLFVERGFDAVTVADIAEAADIGKGTFFTHFPTKAAVFRFIGEQVTTAMVEAVAAASGAAVVVRLRAAYDAAADWCESHRDLVVAIIGARTFTLALDVGSPNQQRALRLLAGLVAEGQASGELRRGVRADDAALALFSTYLVHLVAWTLDVSSPDPHAPDDAGRPAAGAAPRETVPDDAAAPADHARPVRPLGERLRAALDLVLAGLTSPTQP